MAAFNISYVVAVRPSEVAPGDIIKLGSLTFIYDSWGTLSAGGHFIALKEAETGHSCRAESSLGYLDTDELFHCVFVDIPA